MDEHNSNKKTQPITELDCLKNNVVKELFLNTADSSYAVARWSFLNRMYLEFYWNAVHAVEKYFKAVLLLNAKSALHDDQRNSFGHDIRLLLTAVERVYSLNSEMLMVCPEQYGGDWIEEKLVKFVERLYELGEPNNRYNLYGFSQRPEDLAKLDSLVFKTRNIAQYLDGYAFLGSYERNGGENLSGRDLLQRAPNSLHNFSGSKLESLASPKRPVIVKNPVLDQNLYFAPDNYEHPPYSVGWSSANSVFYMRIGIYLENDNYQGRTEDLELIDWILRNIYVPKILKEELQKAREKISNKLKARVRI